ncbi:hypothetical protein [Paraburkholderia sp. BCC1886]|uniref:hypothetical protein n=1 Tax=Paraburkholderia sp. BCC1886 TaxID=2562670 RepID=UPI0011840358|nr:hypothetical protein [Paraburkholderia sp. BCC1886]
MNLYLALETLAVALALLCIALVPVSIHIDPGFARRIVQLDKLPLTRWPNWLTRAGFACLLLSFALLLGACYAILTGAGL